MKFFKSPVFWSCVISLSLAVLLFFGLEYMGVKDKVLRLLITLLFLVITLALVIIITYRHLFSVLKNKNEQQSSGMGNQAMMDKTWAEPLRQETMEALSLLKQSLPSSGISKSKAIPDSHNIYLVMGRSGSGKTSLLENSSLHFSHVYPSESQLSNRMMNFFRWRMSGRSTYIEVPESIFTMGDSSVGEEYEEFLKIMRKESKEKAVNGIILTVNLQDMLGPRQQVEQAAMDFRNRISASMRCLELELPVYVVFTNSDILPGFSDFFSGLEGLEAKQVLGATFSLVGEKQTIKERFNREFNSLTKSIRTKSFAKLKDSSNRGTSEKTFVFPNELHAARTKLSLFVELLFKKSMPDVNMLFRGFFLTSVTPIEGSPDTDAMFAPSSGPGQGFSKTVVSHPLNPQARQDVPVFSRQQTAPKCKAMFTGLFFNGILNNEKSLARLPSYRSSKSSRKLVFICTAIILAAALIFTWGTAGFLQNQRLCERAAAGIRSAKTLKWIRAENFQSEYEDLTALAENIDQLEELRKNGRPWSIGPGLYDGSEALKMANSVYYYQIYKLVMSKTLEELRGDLYYSDYYNDNERDKLYTDLKLYLLLTDQGIAHRDKEDVYNVKEQLLLRWHKIISGKFDLTYLPDNFERSLETHAERYARNLIEYGLPTDKLIRFKSDTKSVENARVVLLGNPSILSIYNAVVNSSDDFPDITLTDIIQSENAFLTTGAKVRGFYTKEGYTKGALNRLDKAAEKPHQKDWVLGDIKMELPPEMKDKRQLARALKARYFEEYANEWNNFLNQISTDVPDDLKILSGKLVGFASATQGITAVLKRALLEVNLVPKKNEHIDNAVNAKMKKSLVGKLAKQKIDTHTDIRQVLKDKFIPVELLVGSGAQKGLLKHYLDGVRSLGQQISEISNNDDKGAPSLEFVKKVFASAPANPLVHCWNQSVTIQEQVPDHIKSWLSPMLQEPLLKITGNLNRLSEQHLDELYRTNVYKKFVGRLKGRYPIDQKGLQEVNPEDINVFFNQNDGVFTGFYKKYLKPYLRTSGGLYSLKQWNGIKIHISPEAMSTINQGIMLSNRIFPELSTTMREYPLNVTLFASPNASSVILQISDMKIEVKPSTAKLSQRISWPGKNAHKGAVITVLLPNGKTRTIEEPGPWGFLKLMKKAMIFEPHGNGFKAIWRLRVAGKYDVDVKINGEIREPQNPFTTKNFYAFKCAPKLIDENPAPEPASTPVN